MLPQFYKHCNFDDLNGLLQVATHPGFGTNEWQYALDFACEFNHIEIVRMILAKPELNISYDTLNNALCRACTKAHLEIIDILLDYIPDNLIEWNHAFNSACFSGNALLISTIFKECHMREIPIDIDEATRCACLGGQLEIVKALCKGDTFTAACEGGNVEIVKYLTALLGSAGDIEYVYRNGISKACRCGHWDVFIFLYDLLGMEARDDIHSTIIDACYGGNMSIIYMLLYKNTKYTRIYNSMIYHAVQNGKLEVLKFLLNHFSNMITPDAIDACYKCACRTGEFEIVKFLIEYATEPLSMDALLRCACKYGNFAMLIYARERIFDVIDWSSALEIACFNGQFEMVDYILTLRPRVHSIHLHNACLSGNLYLVEKLYPILMNSIDGEEWCEIIRRVCLRRHLPIVRFLIKNSFLFDIFVAEVDPSSSEIVKILLSNRPKCPHLRLCSNVQSLLNLGMKLEYFEEYIHALPPSEQRVIRQARIRRSICSRALEHMPSVIRPIIFKYLSN